MVKDTSVGMDNVQYMQVSGFELWTSPKNQPT